MQKILLALLGSAILLCIAPAVSADPVGAMVSCLGGHTLPVCIHGGPCYTADSNGGVTPHEQIGQNGFDIYIPLSDMGGVHLGFSTSCGQVGPIGP